eukprot:gene5590-5828_t
MRLSKSWILLAAFAGALAAVSGQDAATAPAAAPVAPKKTCKTALDLIASQNMNLPVHPVFQNILNSDQLKGTIFIPTTKAWDSFFATMRQRQGNPAAPAMIARYGQILLYHLAKDVNVPVADPTPGANKFAVDTASTLQCTFGPGLPNNRLIVKKTPQAILVQHGTGNATIVSQTIPYCGGEAYLVDQVLNPCSDVAAIMGEIANIPSPCRNNVEGALNKNDLTYFNALLLATGVQRPIFSSGRFSRDQSCLYPVDTDAATEAEHGRALATRQTSTMPPDYMTSGISNQAIINAYKSGALNYPYLYANNATLLEGIVAFHAVPQYQFTTPSKQTLNMKTLLSEGVGEAQCANPSLSWRQDGHVYGGTGSARAGGRSDRGCNTQIKIIDEVLQPCCKPMAELLGGASGLAAKAPKGSIQEKAYQFLLQQVEGGAAGTSFIMPSADAWTQFEADAAKQRINLTDDKLTALFSYLLTTTPVSSKMIAARTPVPMALAGNKKAQASLCSKGTAATLVFASAEADLPASSDVGVASRPVAPAPAMAPAGFGAAAPATAPAGFGAAAPAGFGPSTASAAGFGQATGPASYPATAGPTGFSTGAPGMSTAAAYPTTAPGLSAAPAGVYGKLRRALLQALGGATTGPDSSVSTDLLLPTAFVPKPDPNAGGATNFAAAMGPVMLVDGQEMVLKEGVAIPVTSMTYSCDGAIYNTDAVPLPCNVLNRTLVYPSPPPPPLAALLPPATAAADAVNATEPAVAAQPKADVKSAAAAATPLAASLMAA